MELVFVNTSMWFIVEYNFFAIKSYTYPCHNYSSTFTPNGVPSANRK